METFLVGVFAGITGQDKYIAHKGFVQAGGECGINGFYSVRDRVEGSRLLFQVSGVFSF